MRRFFNGPMVILLGILLVSEVVNGKFSDPKAWLTHTLMLLPAIIIGLSFHEFAHAWVADRLGDDTPRAQGRVTISPLAHVDPIGMLALIFIGFGWGVPVQINPYNFKHRRRDEFLVSIAGITLNFIIALVFVGIIKIAYMAVPQIFYSGVGSIILDMLDYIIFINIVLMIFNLLPVPPLDGFGIITQLFNLEKYSWYGMVYNNGFFILMFLLIFDVVGKILSPAVTFIYDGLFRLFFGF